MMKTYTGSCHCGKIQFEIDADINHVRVCDCSVCRKRGALNFRIEDSAFRLHGSLHDLSLYQWGTKTAEDYFCPVCGILPFRRPRKDDPDTLPEGVEPFDGWTVNIRCLEGIELDALPLKRVSGSQLSLP